MISFSCRAFGNKIHHSVDGMDMVDGLGKELLGVAGEVLASVERAM
jgi:hypothetical protein